MNLIAHYLGVHVLARLAAACLVDTSPSAHRQLRKSNSVHQQLIPTCEDHTSTCSSTCTKQKNRIGLSVSNVSKLWGSGGNCPSMRITKILIQEWHSLRQTRCAHQRWKILKKTVNWKSTKLQTKKSSICVQPNLVKGTWDGWSQFSNSDYSIDDTLMHETWWQFDRNVKEWS